MEPVLEKVFRVPNCFPGVLITGSHCLLDSGVVDPRDDVCNFISSRGCQDDHVRTCLNWLKWGVCFCFPNLQLMPHLLADRGESSYPVEWVSFLRFLGQYGRRLSQGLEVSGHPQVS